MIATDDSFGYWIKNESKGEGSIMDKHKIIKLGSLIGLAAAVGYRVFSVVKKEKEEQQEVIDITPEQTEDARN